MIIYRKEIVKLYTHTKHERFSYHILNIFLVLNSFFAWIRIRIFFAWIRIRIKVRPGSGSITNFFTSWIRIRIKLNGSATLLYSIL